MGDLHDALNNLAGRGTARGFDDVFAAAERDAARNSAPTVSGSGGDGDDLDPIPFVEAEPVARSRRPLHSLIAAAGLAALVLVGGLAVNAAVGSGGGAGSPEAAVRRLADAISHEDPLAAADVIAPEEVRSLHDTLSHAEAKAAELKVVETAGAPLAGIDLNVSGLDLSSETLGDGVAKVTIDAGSISASTHQAQFSALLRKALNGSTDNSAESDLAALGRNANLPTFVVAVRRDGNWYVSAAYTVLEYVREANRLPAADFGSGRRAVATLGADSPDAAVQDTMRALQQRDWSKLISLAEPAEIPVYDYRAALTTLAHRSDATADNWFTLDSLTTSAQVDGDHAKVTLHASGSTDSNTWSIEGGCFTVKPKPGSELEVGSFSYCDDMASQYGIVGGAIFGFPFITLQRDSQISLVRENGRWFVSPIGSVLDVLNGWIDGLDQSKLDQLLGLPPTGPIDGNLVLGQPVTFETGTARPRILAFDGHRGETLIGQGSPFGDIPTNIDPSMLGGVFLRVVGPDGNEDYGAGGLLNGDAFVLPADGQYTFIFRALGRGKSSATIWDYADAPVVVQAHSPGGHPSCTYGRNSSSCSAGGIGIPGDITATTFLAGPSGGESGSSGQLMCTPEMKAKPELKQLCEQLATSPPTFYTGSPPTIGPAATAVAPPVQSSGSGSSSATSVASVPHG